MFGKLLSFWNGPFSRDMLIFRGVHIGVIIVHQSKLHFPKAAHSTFPPTPKNLKEGFSDCQYSVFQTKMIYSNPQKPSVWRRCPKKSCQMDFLSSSYVLQRGPLYQKKTSSGTPHAENTLGFTGLLSTPISGVRGCQFVTLVLGPQFVTLGFKLLQLRYTWLFSGEILGGDSRKLVTTIWRHQPKVTAPKSHHNNQPQSLRSAGSLVPSRGKDVGMIGFGVGWSGQAPIH